MNQGRSENDIEDSAQICGVCGLGMLVILAWALIGSCVAAEPFAFAYPVDLRPIQPAGPSLPIAADGLVGTEVRTAYGYAVAYKVDGKDTLLVSARHVLEHHDLTLRTSRICVDGKWFDLCLDKESKPLDLVILRLKNQHLKTYPIIPMSDLADGAMVQNAQMFLPGALAGTTGSPSGRGIVTKTGELKAVVIRVQSLNGTPVVGECVCAPSDVLWAFTK